MARRTKIEAEDTRRRILDAAERLFFDRGVSQTALEQIAAEAGVTRGAIYGHFANKLDLFRELHERVRLPQEDFVEQAVAEGHPDPLGLLERACLECLATLAEDTQRQRVFTILLYRCEYVGEMLEALARQRDGNERMQAVAIRAFETAARHGMLKPGWTPETAATVFGAMVSGLVSDWLRFGRRFDLVEVGTECVKSLFRSFRADAEACAPDPAHMKDGG